MNRAARRKAQREQQKHMDALKRAPSRYEMLKAIDIEFRRRSLLTRFRRWLTEKVA